MNSWVKSVIESKSKKAMPILSFPAVTRMGITVKELIGSSDLQAQAMKLVADANDSFASVSMMDLSVEAEAFGCEISFSDDEVPTVLGGIVSDSDDMANLTVPKVGAGRTGIYTEAIGKAVRLIKDRPVFAGMIGPFSLVGRLMDINEVFIKCYEEPEKVHLMLEKATEFLIEYARGYKNAGAFGVIMAEPLAGLLSVDFMAEFSEVYVKRIFDAVRDESFTVIYHNCGNNTVMQVESIVRVGADGYHFGNAIDMKQMLEKMPRDVLVMGNIDPVSQFCNGTPEGVKAETTRMLSDCAGYDNYVISSGCDVPAKSSWDNIGAFYEAIGEFYREFNK